MSWLGYLDSRHFRDSSAVAIAGFYLLAVEERATAPQEIDLVLSVVHGRDEKNEISGLRRNRFV